MKLAPFAACGISAFYFFNVIWFDILTSILAKFTAISPSTAQKWISLYTHGLMFRFFVIGQICLMALCKLPD